MKRASFAFMRPMDAIGTKSDILSAHELGYLDHDRRFNPDIDINYFPNTAIGRYWSQTETPDVNSLAWSVDFSNGIPYINEKRLPYHIRLVTKAPYLKDQIIP